MSLPSSAACRASCTSWPRSSTERRRLLSAYGAQAGGDVASKSSPVVARFGAAGAGLLAPATHHSWKCPVASVGARYPSPLPSADHAGAAQMHFPTTTRPVPSFVPCSGATTSDVLCSPVPLAQIMARVPPSGDTAGCAQFAVADVRYTMSPRELVCIASCENTLPPLIWYLT